MGFNQGSQLMAKRKHGIRGLIIGVSLLGLMGCVKVDKDLSQDPKYSFVMRKELKTKSKLVIFQPPNEKIPAVQNFGGALPDRNEIKDMFPYRYYGTFIYGVLPEGSVFKITNIRKEGTWLKSRVRYQGKLVSSKNLSLVGNEFVFAASVVEADGDEVDKHPQ